MSEDAFLRFLFKVLPFTFFKSDRLLFHGVASFFYHNKAANLKNKQKQLSILPLLPESELWHGYGFHNSARTKE